MQNKKLKNTIVLKGMASNIVEEAIVILKPNIKLKQKEYIEKSGKININNSTNNYIVKEAENVVLNYIGKLERKKEIDNNIKKLKKYNLLKLSNILLILLSIIIFLFK